MRFCSLGSGSRGNAHIVEHGETTVLIDCGFGLRTLRQRLAARHLSPGEINAVFISHEHGDHVRGLHALLTQYNIICYMSRGTAQALGYPDGWQRLTHQEAVTVGDLSITPVSVPHDVAEPLQFVVESGARRLALFTDLGHVSSPVYDASLGADMLVIECNHDLMRLQQSPYPLSLKRRISGDYGHLSNAAAAGLVADTVAGGCRRTLVAAHISEENNTHDLAVSALRAADPSAGIVTVSQKDGTDWLSV